MSIEGIVLEHSSALPQTAISSSTKPCPHHALFHSFFSDYIKQDASTNTEHSKYLIKLLKDQKVLTSTLSTIWENTDSCAEKY